MNRKSARSSPSVIINADDFGITDGVNKAILRLAGAGIITSTSVMCNMPHYTDITRLRDTIGVGIHLNLTLAKPVAEPIKIPTLISQNGYFHPLPELIRRMNLRSVSKQEVAFELRAQISRLLDMGIQPDHINSHESFLKYPFFKNIGVELAQEFGIKSFRSFLQRKFDFSRLLSPRKTLISFYLFVQKKELRRFGFNLADRYDSLITFGLDHETALKKLQQMFKDLPQGILEIVVHPGYIDDNSSLLGEYVYEREIELHALMSDSFKSILNASGATLISFSSIN